MKKLLLLTSLLFPGITLLLNSQIAVGYNTDGGTLTLSNDPAKKICWELRANTKYYSQATWSYSDRGITQAYIIFRIFNTEKAGLYAGAGTGVNLLSKEETKWISINVPVGIKIVPFEKFPDLFIIGEYNPMIVLDDELPLINSVSLGIRYRLVKKSK